MLRKETSKNDLNANADYHLGTMSNLHPDLSDEANASETNTQNRKGRQCSNPRNDSHP